MSASLVPLVCTRCGAAVPLLDAEVMPCPYCGAAVAVPADYRRAVALAHARDAELAEAAATWRRFERRRIPAAFCILAALLPPLHLIALFALAAGIALGLDLGIAVAPREVISFGVWPWLPFEIMAAAFLFLFALPGRAIRSSRAALAARGDVRTPRCRVCGAPLTLGPQALFVHCAYCSAENLVTNDAMRERELRGEIFAASVTVREAVGAIQERGGWALKIGLLMPVFVAVCAAPAYLWYVSNDLAVSIGGFGVLCTAFLSVYMAPTFIGDLLTGVQIGQMDSRENQVRRGRPIVILPLTALALLITGVFVALVLASGTP